MPVPRLLRTWRITAAPSTFFFSPTEPSLPYQLTVSSSNGDIAWVLPGAGCLHPCLPLHCTMRKAGWSWWTQGPGCPPVPSTTLTPAMDTHLGRWGPERCCYLALKPLKKDVVTFHPGHIQDFLPHSRLPIIPFYSECDFTFMTLLLIPLFDLWGEI